jgi:hypothetical protein
MMREDGFVVLGWMREDGCCVLMNDRLLKLLRAND